MNLHLTQSNRPCPESSKTSQFLGSVAGKAVNRDSSESPPCCPEQTANGRSLSLTGWRTPVSRPLASSEAHRSSEKWITGREGLRQARIDSVGASGSRLPRAAAGEAVPPSRPRLVRRRLDFECVSDEPMSLGLPQVIELFAESDDQPVRRANQRKKVATLSLALDVTAGWYCAEVFKCLLSNSMQFSCVEPRNDFGLPGFKRGQIHPI
jgi:hypothetical protein